MDCVGLELEEESTARISWRTPSSEEEEEEEDVDEFILGVDMIFVVVSQNKAVVGKSNPKRRIKSFFFLGRCQMGLTPFSRPKIQKIPVIDSAVEPGTNATDDEFKIID